MMLGWCSSDCLENGQTVCQTVLDSHGVNQYDWSTVNTNTRDVQNICRVSEYGTLIHFLRHQNMVHPSRKKKGNPIHKRWLGALINHPKFGDDKPLLFGMVCGGLPRDSPYEIATWKHPILGHTNRSTTKPATTHSASWLCEAAKLKRIMSKQRRKETQAHFYRHWHVRRGSLGIFPMIQLICGVSLLLFSFSTI